MLADPPGAISSRMRDQVQPSLIHPRSALAAPLAKAKPHYIVARSPLEEALISKRPNTIEVIHESPSAIVLKGRLEHDE